MLIGTRERPPDVSSPAQTNVTDTNQTTARPTPIDTSSARKVLDTVLRRQRGRIRQAFLVYGLALLVSGAAIALLGYFAADRLLRVPSAVRILVTLGLFAWAVLALRRRVLYPMQRPFTEGDVAVALERSFPQLHQRVVSALQLRKGLDDESKLRGESPQMIREVVVEAADSVGELPLSELIDPRRTRRLAGLALVAVAALGVTATLQTESFKVFLQRAFGSSVEYPRETTLVVELPDEIEADEYQVERNGRQVLLTMAAGGDLPILVRAEGVVPREVTLEVSTDRGTETSIPMAPRPGNRERFRHVFRRVRGSFRFFAKGGDDPRGDIEVEVRTVEPPLVAQIESRITPPAYTGEPETTTSGGVIEALTGSQVEVLVTTTAAVSEARMVFLDSGRELPLEVAQIQDDSGVPAAFRGTFEIAEADRYEIRLRNERGMTNPRPGTYPIVALRDYEPVGRLLAPDPGDVLVVLPGARIPVRLEAKDDFGLTAVDLVARVDRSESTLDTPLFRAETGATAERTRDRVLVHVLEVPSLESIGPAPAAGDTIELFARLTDVREPIAQTVELGARRIYVVDDAELDRRIASLFRRVREDVERAVTDQVNRRETTTELLASPPDPSRGRPASIVALQVGQVRIVSSIQRVHDGLMRAFDLHLFNDLEGPESRGASQSRDLHASLHAASDERRARLPQFYRQLAKARAEGRIAPMETVLDPVLDMVVTADALAETLGPAAVETIERASVAGTQDDVLAALEASEAIQTEMEKRLRALLDRLDEWTQIQDVVQQARNLRNEQMEIEARTRALKR